MRAAVFMVALGAVSSLSMAIPAGGAFRRAVSPRSFHFPRDHGSHPRFATEWWYTTGILRDDQAREFGFELTFFRSALAETLAVSASPWRARDLIVAHFALTNVDQRRFTTAERVQRAAVGLAGADTTGLHVWLADWSVQQSGDTILVTAADEQMGLALSLTTQKGVVLHGEGGLSVKSADREHTSYYYSMPRLRARGTLRIGGNSRPVEGTSWLDHEFFTGDTPREGLGWDWFSIRLEDGRDVMLYLVREGSAPGYPSGTVIDADGNGRPLDVTGLVSTPLSTWTSPSTGVEYPVRWRLQLPAERLELRVDAVLPDQEVRATASVGFSYWEGLSRFAGQWDGAAVAGSGYVELTGYSAARKDSDAP